MSVAKRPTHLLAVLVAAAIGAMAAQPASAFGGGQGGHGGSAGGGGHGGGFGGGGGGFGGGGFGRGMRGGGRLHLVPGQQGFAFGRPYGYNVHPNDGWGFGQNGDGLSDYAPYGRPVLGCDPTTPSRAHPGCL